MKNTKIGAVLLCLLLLTGCLAPLTPAQTPSPLVTTPQASPSPSVSPSPTAQATPSTAPSPSPAPSISPPPTKAAVATATDQKTALALQMQTLEATTPNKMEREAIALLALFFDGINRAENALVWQSGDMDVAQEWLHAIAPQDVQLHGIEQLEPYDSYFEWTEGRAAISYKDSRGRAQKALVEFTIEHEDSDPYFYFLDISSEIKGDVLDYAVDMVKARSLRTYGTEDIIAFLNIPQSLRGGYVSGFTYDRAGSKFAIAWPQDTAFASVLRSDGFHLFYCDDDLQDGLAMLSIAVQEDIDEDMIDSVVEMIVEDYEDASYKMVPFADTQAHYITWESDDGPTMLDGMMRFDVYFLHNDNALYGILLTSTLEDWEAAQAALNPVLESFRFIDESL